MKILAVTVKKAVYAITKRAKANVRSIKKKIRLASMSVFLINRRSLKTPKTLTKLLSLKRGQGEEHF